MQITTLDWIIVVLSLAVCFIPALWFGRKAGSGLAEFFVSGRSVPWWLAGISMVATTFSTGTPLLVTDIVRRQGVAGNWVWWAFVITGAATIFFYARLWRRSGVMTDLEFYELRYSGKAAAAVRGFRAIYLGLFFNVLIMATTNLAACKIAALLFGFPMWQTLAITGLLSVVFAATAGLRGVLVIDLIQLGIMSAAVTAAAWFAVNAPGVGGVGGLVEQLSAASGPDGVRYLAMLPDFRGNWDMAVAVFIIPLAVQSWAAWYPGSEPGGGSFIAQRMLASRTERDSLAAVLFFTVVHYILRPWPWILVALASLVVFPTLADIQSAFPDADPALIHHDIAYPAMLQFLPAGFLGLMLAGLIAAHSSTLTTLLNWGGSYLVHDFYRRFVRPGASERHCVVVARFSAVLLFAAAALLTTVLDSAKHAFDITLQIGAGTGLIYLLRWYWWRVNAWCEIVAMCASFGISVLFFLLAKYGDSDFPTHIKLIFTVVFTTLCWLAAAWLTPRTDRSRLVDFYRKVRPPGPGWKDVRREAGIAEGLDTAAARVPLSLAGLTLCCAFVWGGIFVVGKLCYGHYVHAAALGVFCLLSGAGLYRVLRRLWSASRGDAESQTPQRRP